MKNAILLSIICFSVLAFSGCSGVTQKSSEFHVAIHGDDNNDGSKDKPFRNIMAAVRLAEPGDVITIHEGTYRERVNPLRGGLSDSERIVYQAAPGAEVVIKGSEVIKGWTKEQGDAWKVIIPNSFFGDFNPYNDTIHGDWFGSRGRKHHTGAVYLNEHWLIEAATLEEVLRPAGESVLWHARVDDTNTAIWAQFKDADPNQAEVEINVRQTVFYPEQPGINYITVRGFTMMPAATPWAPPTAEQIGLIGTHWSKGWIIEDNDIRYSKCVGITLGKYGDEWDNTSQNTAEGYVETIYRALENGWSRENIGSHIVRNNRISHCEQAGIVGSMGAIFSEITGSVIHDIHVHRLFGGAEQGGIKIHGAIDMLIARNHIYNTVRGIWLDWMNQGARVTRNLLHDNEPQGDLFIEVNHGPFVVDNNISLSSLSLDDWSQGGTYAHNLFAGRYRLNPVLNRSTPYHEAHSTAIKGITNIPGGDNRFLNNLFLNSDFKVFDTLSQASVMSGNVFLGNSIPSVIEPHPVTLRDFDPGSRLTKEDQAIYLQVDILHDFLTERNALVTTEMLGETAISEEIFLNYDGSSLIINTDYFGNPRNESNPFPGPFEKPEDEGRISIKIWE